MIPVTLRLNRILALLSVSVSLISCSTLHQQTALPTAPQPVAESLVQRLRQANRDLTTFKGIGSVTLRKSDAPPVSERLAWVGQSPGNLRMVVLASGIPVLKFAFDGRYLYFLDLQSGTPRFNKIRSTRGRLDRLVSLPINTGDIVALLSGKTPLADHSGYTLILEPQGSRLVLKNWWNTVQVIYLDETRKEVQRYDVFSAGGTLKYRVEFTSMQTVNGYRVPRMLSIADGAGVGLKLRIDRFIPGVPAHPSMFTLEPPKTD